MDVIGDAPVAALHHDLKAACLAALEISPTACREFALLHSWRGGDGAVCLQISRQLRARVVASAPVRLQ